MPYISTYHFIIDKTLKKLNDICKEINDLDSKRSSGPLNHQEIIKLTSLYSEFKITLVELNLQSKQFNFSNN